MYLTPVIVQLWRNTLLGLPGNLVVCQCRSLDTDKLVNICIREDNFLGLMFPQVSESWNNIYFTQCSRLQIGSSSRPMYMSGLPVCFKGCLYLENWLISHFYFTLEIALLSKQQSLLTYQLNDSFNSWFCSEIMKFPRF